MSSSALAKFIRRVLVMCFYLYIHIQDPNGLHRFRSDFVAGTAKLRAMPDTRHSDRRCEAPQGGAIKQLEPRNSDRRCEAPQGGAITTTRPSATASPLAPRAARRVRSGRAACRGRA